MKYAAFLITILFFLSGFSSPAQTSKPGTKRYIKTSTGYLMVLRQGDTLFKELEKFALAEQVPSANFTGFGFVNITFGYFNFNKKTYKPRSFKKVELASMQGSIAWQEGKASLHTHGVAAGKRFKAFGGHILSATVSTGSLEIVITVNETRLERIKDEKLGANVLCIDQCR